MINFHPARLSHVYRSSAYETAGNRTDNKDQLRRRPQETLSKRGRAPPYDSHTSFLSSPLLSSIMLLTYEQFADIPNKMHIFYEQAFAALFRRHDAQKAQFIRKTYANLAINDFRSFFSAFCFSYLEERFSFLDKDLRTATTKALKYAGLTTKIDDVLRDLHECLCMLQRDGIYTVFVHRSFQEYFCAVFLASYHGPQLLMLDRFAL